MSNICQNTLSSASPDAPQAAPPEYQSAVNDTFFRKEVAQAHSNQWMGAIRLAQPMSARIVAGLALVIALCLLAYIFFGTVTRKARVTGMTLPVGGSLTISAMNTGILTRSFVNEGQAVIAGQPLFEVSTERQGSSGEISMLVAQQLTIQKNTLASERRTRVAQHREKAAAIDERLVNVNAETLELDQEIALAQRRLDLAKSSLAKYETLQGSGFVSAAQTQQKQEELIDLGARMSTLTRARLQLQASKLNLATERTTSVGELDNVTSQLQRSEAVVDQEIAENHSRKTSLILAPQTGVVATITYRSGQPVAAAQSLAVLIPQANDKQKAELLEVQLYAPSRMIGFVAAGQTVLIRYQAYPYQKFGLHQGRIVDISKAPFAPADLPPQLASTILSNAQQSTPGATATKRCFESKYSCRARASMSMAWCSHCVPG
ncbi:HlyD family efflux transporter periplasmic adaptor subunit [Massilia sp. CCM 8733]|uniref:HlyD family efflux transporter periplasmic adaptor subunit n=1 Tax=Massilia mucilaginosa TaxID=2609282 RepID=A0ABX0NMW0_9BURK|nr:HlyD family efflux transporter periplasmic adaptor subunit [Massilia mucilaginosa]NHZ88161.1 HlyD family efflux transporter periplasmic adaptor subunit [Massilia mucilaginosa]